MWYVFNVCTEVASDHAVSHPRFARRFGRASVGVSIGGIVFTAVLIVIAIFTRRASFCSDYEYLGECYTYKKYVGFYGSCSGVISDNYCYWNY